MASNSSDNLMIDKLMFLIHHVFLPPKLPQQDDSTPSLDRFLIEVVQNAVQEFTKVMPSDYTAKDDILMAIQSLLDVLTPGGSVDEKQLIQLLERMAASDNRKYESSAIAIDACFL